MLAHEPQERSELGAVDRLADIGATHVVDDDRGRQSGKEVPELGQVLRLEVDDDVPAEPLDALGDLDQLVPRRDVDEALEEVEAHAAHPGLGGAARSSSSVTSRRTVATPRARPSLARQASTIARLSAPWQVACTITLRAKPRWSRSAKSGALPASQGVYLRSGANGNSAPGPKTWQWASTAPGGNAKRGLLGSRHQSSQPGVLSKAGMFTSPGNRGDGRGSDPPRPASRRCGRTPDCRARRRLRHRRARRPRSVARRFLPRFPAERPLPRR